MKRAYFSASLFCAISVWVTLSACEIGYAARQEQWTTEIRQTEEAFAKMAADKGLAEAFSFYADAAAVIKRGADSLISGIEGIKNYYSQPFYSNVSLSWQADNITVADDGSLGFSYGPFRWASTDSSGAVQEFTGIFHSVWKRQPDGSWRYIWD